MPDNGIKLFARGGGKLDDSIEALIEARIGEPWERPTGRGVGRAINDEGAKEKYIEHLMTSVATRLDGLKIVVDCANGAASFVAPDALARAGASVVAISHAPDGWNINDNCGSTYLANLKAAVIKEGADFGIAHDGDADRCLAVDAQGNEVDGDMIMTAAMAHGATLGAAPISEITAGLSTRDGVQALALSFVAERERRLVSA
jgi:phosphoglucosamine mutase